MKHIALLPIMLLLSLSSPPPQTASETASDLERKVQAAAHSGNHKARIDGDLQLVSFLNGSPAAVEALGRAYAAAGDSDRALAALNRVADLGQADDNMLNGTDPSFSTLKSQPEYKRVLARFAENQASMFRASVAFLLPDVEFLPEDIDYDAGSKSFLITSIRQHRIIRESPDGTFREFASSPDGWPMAALKIDSSRSRVWATEVAFDGLVLAPVAAWGRSAVLCFDLHTGRLLERIDGPLHSSLGDMTLNEDGDPIVSDGDNGIVYRVASRRLSEINRKDFISPQTPTGIASRDETFVPDYVRGIGRLNLRSGQVSWLNKNGEDNVAINGIDGLYLSGRSMIATQNGTSPERIVLFNLNSERTHILSATVIEQRAGSHGSDPTHGVLVGSDFYYIVHSGWAALDDHGKVRSGAKLERAVVMKYKLQ